MKCETCNTEWEGEGTCPVCSETTAQEAPETPATKRDALTAEADETAAAPAEATEVGTAPEALADASSPEAGGQTSAETPVQETAFAPIPMPLLSEGFAAGTGEKPKKKIRASTAAVLSIFLTAAVLVLAFFATGYFVKDADLLHLFHAAPEEAEDVILASFEAIYENYDVDAYLELFPPRARESYAQSMASSQGFESVDEMITEMEADLAAGYETFVFSSVNARVVYTYTDEGIENFLATDYQSALFGTDYTAEEIEEIASVELDVTFSVDGAEESATTLSFLSAAIDGEWYQIM